MKTRTRRRLKIAAIAIAGVLVVLVLLITIAGGAFMPRDYLDPWDRDYYQRFADPRIQSPPSSTGP